MVYTLGEAAKATGKSKPTIQRAIKGGVLSATKKDDGSYAIDPSELHRVFPPLPKNSNDTGTMKQSGPPHEIGVLQREIELLRERLDDKDNVIEDLRCRLDSEAEERRKLTTLLTDQRTKADSRQPQPGFWSRLFNRR